MLFSYLEKQVFKQGYRVVAGIDEVGRGSLAGPVAAAVVAVKKNNSYTLRQAQGILLLPERGCSSSRGLIRDSKQLTEKQREEIFERIKDNPNFLWRVSFIWPKTIDKINIWQATLLAWRRCLQKLNTQPDFLFLDGKFDLWGQCSGESMLEVGTPTYKGFPHLTQKPVIKGDQKILLLSLASIMAKVSRDRLMKKLDKRYQEYSFSRHKGYGTRIHLERLKKFGPSKIHRRSFRPVFDNLPFREKVYYAVSQIPKGQTMTYQAVARRAGRPRAYRAVGNILNKNKDPKIPCHRVIRSDGKLGEYNRGSRIKEKLLKKDGFRI